MLDWFVMLSLLFPAHPRKLFLNDLESRLWQALRAEQSLSLAEACADALLTPSQVRTAAHSLQDRGLLTVDDLYFYLSRAGRSRRSAQVFVYPV